MKYISLFAGIGGFDLALQALGHECVYANEWNKYAAQIYEKNFGERPDTRSITDVSDRDIPEHDLLCGGFPCQAFSAAGKRQGFADTRGTLFFEIARIADAKKSPLLFLENVKGLLTHDNGRTFETILWTLDGLGYDLQWQVCNSKYFGVPQNRERVFIVGHLRGYRRPEIFPLRREDHTATQTLSHERERTEVYSIATRHLGRNGKLISDVAPTIQSIETPHVVTFNRLEGIGKEIDTAHTLNASDYRGLDRNQDQTAIVVDHGELRETQVANAVDANYWKGLDNHGQRTGLYMVSDATGLNCPSRGPEPRKDGMATTIRAGESGTKNRIILEGEVQAIDTKQQGDPRFTEHAPTLQASGHKDPLKVLTHKRIRRLTPIECERLQGFPDNWTEGLSDTQRYKCIGNAVTVNVIYAIARKFPKRMLPK